jgi:AAA domain-containing protein
VASGLDELWQADVARVTQEDLARLATWRHWETEFCRYLLNESAIGLHILGGTPCWSFPVYDLDRQLVSLHCRSNDGWRYDPLGGGTHPLIRGNFNDPDFCFISESTWDALCIEYLVGSELRNHVLILGTCGAGNARMLTDIELPQKAPIFAVPQNDEAGTRWLKSLVASLVNRPLRLVRVPEPHKDLNDWLRAGGDSKAFGALLLHSAALDPSGRLPYQPRGGSIVDYAARSIDPSANLLGNRWLSRRQGGFIVGPTGHGKSTLIIQAAILWSAGRAAFGIAPPKPLRVLILQAEDDDNDVTEMAQMCDRLALSQAQVALVRTNTHLEWLNDCVGASFFQAAADLGNFFHPDLILINPLTAYLDCDIQNNEGVNNFLRVKLSSLLNKLNAGALIVQHSPKTQFQKTRDFNWFDWSYSMAGGASLSNWARAILVLVPSPDEVALYRLIAAKRFEKIGWQERESWFCHSSENAKPLWLPAPPEQIPAAKTKTHPKPEDVLQLIPPVDPLSESAIIEQCKRILLMGRDRTRRILSVLTDQNKIFVHKIARPNAKAAIGYAQCPAPVS